MRRLCFSVSLIALTIGNLHSSAVRAAPASDSPGEVLEEVVVTARRKEENAQTVPVSVNVFSAERLQDATIQTLNDVSTLTPGLRISNSGGASQSSLSLRGVSKQPVGDAVPGVVIYFDEASLPNSGVDIPLYDLDNVQVLRGPQGTLFGRNALGGAVLLTSKAPTYDWDGYAKGSYGSYNYGELQGAQNIPLIQDKLAVRVAVNFRYRDGLQKAVPNTLTTTFGPPYNQSYTQSTPGGGNIGNVNQESVRASILYQPIDGVTNTTILDFFKADERSMTPVVFKFNPGFLPSVFGPVLGPVLANGYNNGIGAAVAAQMARGPWQIVQTPGVDYAQNRESSAIINTTRFDVSDNFHIKNIASYRLTAWNFGFSTDGLPLIPGPIGAFNLYKPTGLVDDRRMYSEELQFQGTAFNKIIDYTFGVTALWDTPRGPGGIYTNGGFTFTPIATTPLNWASEAIGARSQGVYGQISVDLSQWIVQGLKLTLGARNSWDQAYGCGAQTQGGFVSLEGCRRVSTEVRLSDANQRPYTLGLEWKVNDALFLYAATHHGYRGVNVNPPLFTSPYTTGAPGLCIGGQNCPDLRPFQGTKPDTVTDYEVGIKTNWRVNDVRGRFNLDVYDSKYKNLVEFVNYQGLIPASAPDFPASGSIGLNVANLDIKGVELDSSIVPFRGLTVSLNGAYTNQAVDRILVPIAVLAGQGINRPSPKWSGTLSVEYVAPFHPFGADLVTSADNFYTGETREQAGFPINGYNVLNTRVQLSNIADKKIDVGFWVRNSLDRTYIASPTVVIPGFPINGGIYGEPRMFGADIGYKW
jgi:iron complex outermembrane receptor protein